MELFHPSCNRRVFEKWISSCNGELYIFSPFFTDIGLESISKHIPENTKINLLVRASFNDFISGALSVSALKKALSLNWHIRRFEHLHAKAFFNSNTLYFGSVNLTGRGLGYPPNGNFELLAKTETLDSELIDELLFVWKESIFINSDYIKEIDKISNLFVKEYNEYKKILNTINAKYNKQKEFSLRDIVQSDSLLSFYEKLNGGGSNDSIFYHDYNLLCAYDGIDFEQLLKNFLNIELINKFLLYVGDGRFFGDLRRWLVDNVEDVPTPSRDDFNTQLNKLYDLVIEATQGKYRRIIPAARSEKLEKINGS